MDVGPLPLVTARKHEPLMARVEDRLKVNVTWFVAGIYAGPQTTVELEAKWGRQSCLQAGFPADSAT